ncbi:MAG: DUF4445 domain-containing protein [Chloroflexi bacterium]|nr:DUF4445 domain-containing protein [Chloroflexota bacterium]
MTQAAQKPTHFVVFQPSGRRGYIEEGAWLLDAAHHLGVELETICGKMRTCGKCKVRVEDGPFERYGIESSRQHLSRVIEKEREHLGAQLDSGYRLACAARVLGDVVVYVPEESRAVKQVVRKSATERVIEVQPAMRKLYVELRPPSLENPLGDWERLTETLREVFHLDNLTIDHRTLAELSRAMRANGWKATVTLWNDHEVIRVQPGLTDQSVGLAVDVGTTTVAGYLCDLRTGAVMATEAMMNPQVSYGEDVMARITYAMTHEDGLAKLNSAIIDGLNTVARNACEQVGLTPEEILEVVLVGNTAMHHLFTNIYPEHLGKSPFPPTLHHSIDVKARDLGLRVHISANAHILPVEAGFVGADNVAVLIAEEPYNHEEIALVIDIGTNGELVLGNRERLISSSCATGPAFEGAHIRFGMRAAPGSIERVRIDLETLEARFRAIGSDCWSDELPPDQIGARGICGSGIIEAIAEMFRTGIIDKTGRFSKGLTHRRLHTGEDGPGYVLAWARETCIGRDITVSIKDIRALQLAKGAMYAGAKLMMRRLGVQKLDRVILAGAFGSYIDRERSMLLGLFPDCELDDVYAVGNAAGDGARIALLNVAKREEANRIARQVEYVELTVESAFEREFMAALHLPHMRDSFPHLEAWLAKVGCAPGVVAALPKVAVP